MRISPLLLLATSLWAQPPAGPSTVPPPLEPLARLINDYGNLRRYAADNAKVQLPVAGEERVVFMGDSITDFWGRQAGQFFPGKPYINRGISGQVTSQMLLRFHLDVVALKPRAVVILAGTNDIGGNLGPTALDVIEDNLAAMTEMARANNIKVVLSALQPVCDYHRPQTQTRPLAKIVALNRWIKEYTNKNGLVYLDYYSATVDDKGMFRTELTDDGLHPNGAGYDVMMPLAAKAIAAALSK
ncbi:MAG TPA: SGNH/GDSL hydrolase family protein [Candidatus Acidoferrales bacterium]|nr:SGNH/GDSL hydrolase family protein [Candidatus Acidoferrales bacterium]